MEKSSNWKDLEMAYMVPHSCFDFLFFVSVLLQILFEFFAVGFEMGRNRKIEAIGNAKKKFLETMLHASGFWNIEKKSFWKVRDEAKL
jgi:hypothetical protein